MPPVLGPVSPSPTRLWSCAVASGSTCSPSQSAKKLASSPTRNSSITTSAPAAPNAPAKQASMAASAAAARLGDDHAFAGGKPVGLDDDRQGLRGEVGLGGARIVEAAVGGGRDGELAAQVLGEALGAFELRRRLGRAERLDPGRGQIVGDARPPAAPRGRRPRSRSRCSRQKRDDSRVVGHIEGHAVGDLGDAGIARRAVELAEQRAGRRCAQASACSRPPEPMRRTFIQLPRKSSGKAPSNWPRDAPS